jgi:alpha-N-arabinofuranosidase
MGTSSLDITPTASTMNALGLVYQVYGEHFPGLIPVALSGNSPQPEENPSFADEPKTSSGSPTYPLDLFAAISPDRKFLTVSVVNATESEQKFGLNISGVRLAGPSTLWQITASSLDAVNKVGEPPQVQVKETAIGTAPQTVTVAPISVNIYRFPVAPAGQ